MTCEDCYWWNIGCILAFDWDKQPRAEDEPCIEFDRREQDE